MTEYCPGARPLTSGAAPRPGGPNPNTSRSNLNRHRGASYSTHTPRPAHELLQRGQTGPGSTTHENAGAIFSAEWFDFVRKT